MILVHWIELQAGSGGILECSPKPLHLPAGTTVGAALSVIGLNPAQATLLIQDKAVAVYGQYAADDTVLHEGDRLEILDALSFDPMESRRRRAQHKIKTKRQKEMARHERRSRRQSKTAI